MQFIGMYVYNPYLYNPYNNSTLFDKISIYNPYLSNLKRDIMNEINQIYQPKSFKIYNIYP